MNEEWRPIPGCDGRYEASSHGRVRSVRGGRRLGVVLSPGSNRTGHLHVWLCLGRPKASFLVHRLVAAAFIGPAPEGADIDHIDFNPKNNRPENLQYLSRGDNSRRSRAAGRYPSTAGEVNGRARLTEDQVRAIRASQDSDDSLAARFGVSARNIQSVRNRQSWKHLSAILEETP